MSFPLQPTIKGRGSAHNTPNRFERLHVADEVDGEPVDPDERPALETVFLKDNARTIIATNNSPDVGFTHSINPYRGCEHGWIYSGILPRSKCRKGGA